MFSNKQRTKTAARFRGFDEIAFQSMGDSQPDSRNACRASDLTHSQGVENVHSGKAGTHVRCPHPRSVTSPS